MPRYPRLPISAVLLAALLCLSSGERRRLFCGRDGGHASLR
jgi:hypothetical protein